MSDHPQDERRYGMRCATSAFPSATNWLRIASSSLFAGQEATGRQDDHLVCLTSQPFASSFEWNFMSIKSFEKKENPEIQGRLRPERSTDAQ